MVTSDCGLCKKPVKDKEKVVCEGGCTGIFHMKCLSLTEYDLNNIRNKEFLVVMCEDCRGKIKSFFKIEKDVEVIENKLNGLQKLIEDHFKLNTNKLEEITDKATEGIELQKNAIKVNSKLETKVRNVISANKESAEQSYASVVKASVIVKPKKMQNADKTKQEVKEAINSAESGIQIAGVKKVSNGAIVIQCENDDAKSKLREDLVEK